MILFTPKLSTPANDPASTVSAAVLTQDPQRLQALCALWSGTDRDLWLTLQGGSMMPNIRPGSRLRVHCNRAERTPGDIIAFRRGGALIIHRLKHFDANGNFICQGDANAFLDAPASPEDVVGVVTDVRPPGMWVQARQNVWLVLHRLRGMARRGRNFWRTLQQGSHR